MRSGLEKDGRNPAPLEKIAAFGRLPLNVSGEFTVLPVRNADVRAAVDGIIEQVYVQEGDRVREGDRLVRLSERDYRAGLENGVVTTPKLHERIGERVSQGDLILEVYEMERITPEVLIPEKEIGEVEPGQPVALRARAYPGRSFAGRVKAIAPAAAVEEGGLGRTVFRVSIEMEAPADLLKPEMTGNAKIYCGDRSIAHLLTRRIARYVRVEFWSWW